MEKLFAGLKGVIFFVAIVASIAGVIVIMSQGFGAFWNIVVSHPIIGVPWLILTAIGLVALIGLGFLSIGIG
jgi:hypothetical protein